MIAADGPVPVPLRFVPLGPGRYPCKILLTSKNDVRLYCIEGVVNEERPEARFDFETPAFEALTQNIPIVSTNFLFSFLGTFFIPTATVSKFSSNLSSKLVLIPNCIVCGHLLLQFDVTVLFLNINVIILLTYLCCISLLKKLTPISLTYHQTKRTHGLSDHSAQIQL